MSEQAKSVSTARKPRAQVNDEIGGFFVDFKSKSIRASVYIL